MRGVLPFHQCTGPDDTTRGATGYVAAVFLFGTDTLDDLRVPHGFVLLAAEAVLAALVLLHEAAPLRSSFAQWI